MSHIFSKDPPSSLHHARSTERRTFIELQLQKAGIAAERISGIDGTLLSGKIDGIDPELYRKCHGRLLRPPEIGNFLSHLKALQTI